MTFNQVCLQVVNKDAPARMCLIALTSSAASHHTAQATDSTDVDALTATFDAYLLRALTQSGQEASTAPSI